MSRNRVVAATLGILALAAWTSWRYRRRPDSPIPATGGQALTIAPVPGIPYYLQTDSRWALEPLGVSPLHMSDSGCVVSSVAMALCAAGHQTSPLELCRSLNAAKGFTSGGLLLWRSVETVSGGSIEVRFPPLSHGSIDSSLRDGTPVIAKILLSPTVPHWVLIVGKQGLEYEVMDPLNPRTTLIPLSSRSATIQSIRVVRRRPSTG